MRWPSHVRRALALAVAVSALGDCSSRTSTPPPETKPPPRPSETATTTAAYTGDLFPANRVVAYYGAAGAPSLGVLGSAPPERIVERLEKQAAAYAPFGRHVIPAFELIVVVAHAAAGASGDYNGVLPDATIQRYLDAIRAHHGILIIDIQPGRARFLPAAEHFEKFLEQPDVALALDPEWEMGPSQIPGTVIGGTTGEEVDAVGKWLAALTTAHRLPQKLFVIHEFTPQMIADRSAIVPRPALATTFHVDGFGSRAKKLGQYRLLTSGDEPAGISYGFKLFYTQDTDLIGPSATMKIVPQPSLITYE